MWEPAREHVTRPSRAGGARARPHGRARGRRAPAVARRRPAVAHRRRGHAARAPHDARAPVRPTTPPRGAPPGGPARRGRRRAVLPETLERDGRPGPAEDLPGELALL